MRYKPTDYEWAKRPFLANKPRGVLRVNDLLAHDLFRLPSSAEAGFAKAGNRFPPSDKVRGQAFRDHALCY